MYKSCMIISHCWHSKNARSNGDKPSESSNHITSSRNIRSPYENHFGNQDAQAELVDPEQPNRG
jgi:hypothetical protein